MAVAAVRKSSSSAHVPAQPHPATSTYEGNAAGGTSESAAPIAGAGSDTSQASLDALHHVDRDNAARHSAPRHTNDASKDIETTPPRSP
eukprot:tig00020724_g13418.t1